MSTGLGCSGPEDAVWLERRVSELLGSSAGLSYSRPPAEEEDWLEARVRQLTPQPAPRPVQPAPRPVQPAASRVYDDPRWAAEQAVRWVAEQDARAAEQASRSRAAEKAASREEIGRRALEQAVQRASEEAAKACERAAQERHRRKAAEAALQRAAGTAGAGAGRPEPESFDPFKSFIGPSSQPEEPHEKAVPHARTLSTASPARVSSSVAEPAKESAAVELVQEASDALHELELELACRAESEAHRVTGLRFVSCWIKQRGWMLVLSSLMGWRRNLADARVLLAAGVAVSVAAQAMLLQERFELDGIERNKRDLERLVAGADASFMPQLNNEMCRARQAARKVHQRMAAKLLRMATARCLSVETGRVLAAWRLAMALERSMAGSSDEASRADCHSSRTLERLAAAESAVALMKQEKEARGKFIARATSRRNPRCSRRKHDAPTGAQPTAKRDHNPPTPARRAAGRQKSPVYSSGSGAHAVDSPMVGALRIAVDSACEAKLSPHKLASLQACDANSKASAGSRSREALAKQTQPRVSFVGKENAQHVGQRKAGLPLRQANRLEQKEVGASSPQKSNRPLGLSGSAKAALRSPIKQAEAAASTLEERLTAVKAQRQELATLQAEKDKAQQEADATLKSMQDKLAAAEAKANKLQTLFALVHDKDPPVAVGATIASVEKQPVSTVSPDVSASVVAKASPQRPPASAKSVEKAAVVGVANARHQPRAWQQHLAAWGQAEDEIASEVECVPSSSEEKPVRCAKSSVVEDTVISLVVGLGKHAEAKPELCKKTCRPDATTSAASGRLLVGVLTEVLGCLDRGKHPVEALVISSLLESAEKATSDVSLRELAVECSMLSQELGTKFENCKCKKLKKAISELETTANSWL